jgi:hypothetical protein
MTSPTVLDKRDHGGDLYDNESKQLVRKTLAGPEVPKDEIHLTSHRTSG